MSKAEYIGKSHEKLTRDILNNDEHQPDTIEKLSRLSEDQKERVEIGAEKTATYLRENTTFDITKAIEVGDDRKQDPNDDTDLLLKGKNDSMEWSLKMTSNTNINVRNTLASVMCDDILEQPIEEVLTESEYEKYETWKSKYENGECSGSEMASKIRPIFVEKFSYALEKAEDDFRDNILEDVRLDSNTVAAKVTKSGNFGGFASMNRTPLQKLADGNGDMKVYTTENNNTSIFFDIDGELVFRMDMYGQYAGRRMDRIKTVYRIQFE